MSTGMNLTALVTVLAALFAMWTSINVGRMRGKHGIKAPATSGHPEFERAYRVQMNTVENLPVFLPILWLTAFYWYDILAAALGAVWVAGRVLYLIGYMEAPEKRGTGFMIQGIATIALALAALAGALIALF